jgi:hypothetical protein
MPPSRVRGDTDADLPESHDLVSRPLLDLPSWWKTVSWAKASWPTIASARRTLGPVTVETFLPLE